MDCLGYPLPGCDPRQPDVQQTCAYRHLSPQGDLPKLYWRQMCWPVVVRVACSGGGLRREVIGTRDVTGARS